MSRSMTKRGVSIKDKLETFHLSFELEELKKSIEDNLEKHPTSCVSSHGKKAWFNGNFPSCVEHMDRQLRKRFNIGEKNKCVPVIYYPPEFDDKNKPYEKTLQIKENKPNVISRFLISSIQEMCDVTIGSHEPDKLELRPWVAYKTPEMVGGMLSYTFSNERHLIIPPRKGFRQVRKTKNVSSRYLIVLDYLVSKDELEQIQKLLNPEKKEDFQQDPKVLEALKDLQ